VLRDDVHGRLTTRETGQVSQVNANSVGSGSAEDGIHMDISSQSAGHLPDDALVIRGGEMRRRTLMLSATGYEADHPGEYALSFWSWPGMTADEIALRVGRRVLPHPRFRKCAVGKIRGLEVSDGRPLDLARTGPRDGHYTLLLPAPPTDDDLDALGRLFDPSQPNPAALEEVTGNA
jgi:hypothetical protein